MPSKTKVQHIQRDENGEADELAAKLARYGCQEFTDALTAHFHRAKRAALEAQADSKHMRSGVSETTESDDDKA